MIITGNFCRFGRWVLITTAMSFGLGGCGSRETKQSFMAGQGGAVQDLCKPVSGFLPEDGLCRHGAQTYFSEGGEVVHSYTEAVLACASRKLLLATFDQYVEFEARGGLEAFNVPMRDIFWTSTKGEAPANGVLFYPGNGSRIETLRQTPAAALCVSSTSDSGAPADLAGLTCREESDYFRTTEVGCKDMGTGLVWSQPSKSTLNWKQFTDYCAQLRQGKKNTWRFPTTRELLAVGHPEKGTRHLNFDTNQMFWAEPGTSYNRVAVNIRQRDATLVVFTSGAGSLVVAVPGIEARVLCVTSTQ